MKKKIAGLIVAGAVALTSLAGVATYAYFSDTATSSNNTVQAGTLELNAFRDDMLISGPMFYTAPDAQNQGLKPTGLWKPGKSEARGLVIKNEGTVGAKMGKIYAVSDDGKTYGGADTAFNDFADQTQVSVTALSSGYNNFDYRDVSAISAALETANAEVQAYISEGTHTDAEVNALMQSKLNAIAAQRGSYWNATYLGADSLATMLQNNRIWPRPDVQLDAGKSLYFVYSVWYKNLNTDQNANQGKAYKFTFKQDFKQN